MRRSISRSSFPTYKLWLEYISLLISFCFPWPIIASSHNTNTSFINPLYSPSFSPSSYLLSCFLLSLHHSQPERQSNGNPAFCCPLSSSGLHYVCSFLLNVSSIFVSTFIMSDILSSPSFLLLLPWSPSSSPILFFYIVSHACSVFPHFFPPEGWEVSTCVCCVCAPSALAHSLTHTYLNANLAPMGDPAGLSYFRVCV